MKQTTDLLLVRPGDKKNIYGDLSFSLAAVEPPLWAALIAAYARSRGLSVRILDMEADNMAMDEAVQAIADVSPALVVMVTTGSNLSASTWKMHGAGLLARNVKAVNPAIPVMFWGLHPSALPGRTLLEEACDFVCRGEGFETVVMLTDSLKKGNTRSYDSIPGLCYREKDRMVITDHGPLVNDLDLLPDPAWDLLSMDRYRAHNWHCFDDIEKRSPYGVVYTSLGCPYACGFCSLHQMFGKRGIRYRSPERVTEEIEHLNREYGIRNIKILDECFVINRDHTERICDLVSQTGLDLNIWAYARIDTVDESLLHTMKKAGVRWLCYGIESGSDRVLETIAKGRFNTDRIRQVVDMTRRAGIYILANFMFGFDEDTLESMSGTLAFAKELHCEYTNFYSVMAYPGSKLYEDARLKGVKLPETWLGYSQYSPEALPLPTRTLSGSQVLKFRDEAFMEFHGSDRYLDHLEKTFGASIAFHMKQLADKPLFRKHT